MQVVRTGQLFGSNGVLPDMELLTATQTSSRHTAQVPAGTGFGTALSSYSTISNMLQFIPKTRVYQVPVHTGYSADVPSRGTFAQPRTQHANVVEDESCPDSRSMDAKLSPGVHT
jgi:hypothetical protein